MSRTPPSDFDNKIWIKKWVVPTALTRQPRTISLRIANDARAADREFAALVGVAIDPEIYPVQEFGAVAHVSGRYYIVFHARPDGFTDATMVRDHDLASRIYFADRARDEFAGVKMPAEGIGRTEALSVGILPDLSLIHISEPCLLYTSPSPRD